MPSSGEYEPNPTSSVVTSSVDPYITYFNSEPVFAQSYQEAVARGDRRTPSQWMQGHIASSPGDQQKFQAMTSGQAPAPTPTTVTPPPITPTPTQQPQPDAGSPAPQAQPQPQPTTPGTQPPPSAGGFSDLLTPSATLPTANPQQSSVNGVANQNYNQVQNANQGGQFATVGQSAQQQTGNTTQNTSGTSTTAPVDTLGFGALLQGGAANATARDATSQNFLTDMVNTGGASLNSQFDKGIRQSLTGPQMTGAGDSARGRAAGYAAADIARNNVGQRLQAAQQLSGPTATTTLAGAANPFVGQTNNTSGSTTGFSDLLTKAAESQAGVTAGQSSQASAGQIPQGQPVKSGGCVLCTAAIELNLSKHHRVLRRVIKHKLGPAWKDFRLAARGYFFLFTPFARFLLSHPRLATLLWPLAKMVVYEELRVSGRKLPLRVGAWLVHWAGHTACAVLGILPVRGHVTDPIIVGIAKRNNILFEVQS